MSESALAGQLKALETQLAALRAQARAGGEPATQSFADLYGILAGQAESTEEEIEAAKYRVDWTAETKDETLSRQSGDRR